MTTSAPEPLPVVVGVDDSPASLAAMRVGADEAVLRGAALLVVHVWHFPLLWGARLRWPDEVNPATHIEQHLQAEVAAMQAERSTDGRPAAQVSINVIDGEIEPELRALAEKSALLVLGQRTHHGPRDVLGSISHAFVTHPPCPVLIVPAPKH
jgi:nucleotide-binding universal stress UspA family protein